MPFVKLQNAAILVWERNLVRREGSIYGQRKYIFQVSILVWAISILLNPIIVATGSRRKLEVIAQCCLWDVASSLIKKLSHDVSLVFSVA